MTHPPPTLARLLQSLASGDSRPVVVIDGGAGSGKTTLAHWLVDNWPVANPPDNTSPPKGVQLVSLDDLYPGWEGLAAASAAVPDLVGGTGFHTWDWERNAPGPWRGLDPTRALIVEGCGALTPASSALAGLAIWIDVPAAQRRVQALARDGEEFAAHWDGWAAQESAHWLANRPWELADLSVGEGGR